jgi:lysyl-tRNA synthetase class 1
MFWADKIVDEIQEKLMDRIKSGEPLVIRDEKTASGRVHVGSMRGVAIHGIISRILTERGIPNTFFYEINDIDPMDDIPSYLDEAKYRPHFMRPLYQVPSPEPGFENYAEYYGQEFANVIEETGFHPQFYRATELYQSGRMNDAIRTALDRRDLIREIYKKVSGSQKGPDWFPISIVTPVCGPGETTKIVGWDGNEIQYVCEPSGKEGSISSFDGNAKFPWKVDWPAKFMVMNVDIEGAGKDHSTKGGARDVANHICREVFEHEPPFDVPYEFFLVGGQKMSSSKGRGASARELCDLLPPHIFRLALLGKDYKKQINFDPSGDTVPVLFDQYDKLAAAHFASEESDESRLFTRIHREEDNALLQERFLPRFSQVAFLVQMPHLDYEGEIAGMKGGELSEAEKAEAHLRAEYAKRWIDLYAPEDFVFKLQTDEVPELARNFSEIQKQALKKVLEYVESHEFLDGQELHTTLHDIRKETNIEPKEFFGALYTSFLGKPSGPKAGWFLSVLEQEFLVSRLQEVSQ